MIEWLVLLHVLALHSSMAAMEFFSTLILVVVLLRRPGLDLLRFNRTLVIWMALFVLAVAVSLIATPQQKPFLFQFGFMRWVLLVWAFAYALLEIWSPRFEWRLIKTWAIAAAITGCYAIVQSGSGADFIRSEAVEHMGGGIYRAVGFFSLSITFAYAMGISAFGISLPAFRWTEWGPFCVTFAALGVVGTFCRGAWVAGIASILLYLALNHRRLVLPVSGAIVSIGGILVFANRGFARRIMGMVTLTLDHSSNVRLDLWRGYWQMFLDHPLFGIGLLNGDKVLPGMYARLGIEQSFVSHAHNNLLQFLGGTGLFGFICYVAVAWIFLVKAWRLRIVNRDWGWSLFLAQVFLHIGGLTEANFIAAIVNHFLMFIWGMTLMLEYRAAKTA